MITHLVFQLLDNIADTCSEPSVSLLSIHSVPLNIGHNIQS